MFTVWTCRGIPLLLKVSFFEGNKKLTAEAILKYLEDDLLHCFGVPEVIVSDNGVQFKTHAFYNLQNIKQHTRTLPYTLFRETRRNG